MLRKMPLSYVAVSVIFDKTFENRITRYISNVKHVYWTYSYDSI